MKKNLSLLFFFLWTLTYLSAQVETLKPVIVAKIPHPPGTFTQGLSIEKQYLYESSGLYGKSRLTCTNLHTGKVIKEIALPSKYFAEGIATLSDRLIQITWREQTAFVYDRSNLNLLKTIPYKGEGWGLCYDDNALWLSNGTSILKRCNPKTLSVEEYIPVKLNGRPVHFLNDLTIADKHIYANVWPKDIIVRIDKRTGRVDAVLETSDLLSPEERAMLGKEDVLNGIAYRPERNTFFVTGKGWPWIFEVVFASNSELSLEEKVGQLLLVHFNGTIANDEAQRLINDCHVGGFIYYQWSNGLTAPSQVKALSDSLNQIVSKKNHPIPLLIGVDQEGGTVNRLSHEFTHFPGNRTLAQSGRWIWGYQSALYTGQELASVGININFAPVIDVQPPSNIQVIGTRSYGSDPLAVTYWGSLTTQGYRDAGMISVLKHFPGHGSATADSHEMLPYIRKAVEELDASDLAPFRSLMPEADVIMSAHLFVPALDKDQCVTFSKKIITELLRNKFQYSGVIMTDSLAMEGILSQESKIEEAVLKSLLAGHDIVLIGGKQLLSSQHGLEFTVDDIVKIHRYIVEAVKTGKYPEESLNASVERIIALKTRYKLSNSSLTKPSFNLKEHQQLAQQIANQTLSVQTGKNPSTSTDSAIALSYEDAQRVGRQIWQNESRGSLEGLTCWNQGEEFASLGIGHCIWYPVGQTGHFKEKFPELLAFFKAHHIVLPHWLENAKGAPWKSREEFYRNFHDEKMVQLREILAKHVDLQILFMIDWLNNALPRMLTSLEGEHQRKIFIQFHRLASTPAGIYALLDYLNFKGEGIAPNESYQGHRWGLLQVLDQMDLVAPSSSAVEQFVEAAKKVLYERIQHAPKERNEQRWLQGWFNRLDTYST